MGTNMSRRKVWVDVAVAEDDDEDEWLSVKDSRIAITFSMNSLTSLCWERAHPEYVTASSGFGRETCGIGIAWRRRRGG